MKRKNIPAETYKPIHTAYGTIQGRDAIIVNDVQYAYDDDVGAVLRISGRVSGSAVSHNPDRLPHLACVFVFENVLAFSVTEIDTYGFGGGSVSSFDQVFHSRWKADLLAPSRTRVTSKHTHYHLRTNDDIFNIIALSFTITFTPAEPD